MYYKNFRKKKYKKITEKCKASYILNYLKHKKFININVLCKYYHFNVLQTVDWLGSIFKNSKSLSKISKGWKILKLSITHINWLIINKIVMLFWWKFLKLWGSIICSQFPICQLLQLIFLVQIKLLAIKLLNLIIIVIIFYFNQMLWKLLYINVSFLFVSLN